MTRSKNMRLTEEERAALEQFRRHRRENPAGLSSDAWLRTPDAVTLADAMLRLFPVDDDELVTASWFAVQLGSIDRFEFGSTYRVERSESGQWEVWLYEYLLREIKTRGQFRQLCRALGIDSP